MIKKIILFMALFLIPAYKAMGAEETPRHKCSKECTKQQAENGNQNLSRKSGNAARREAQQIANGKPVCKHGNPLPTHQGDETDVITKILNRGGGRGRGRGGKSFGRRPDYSQKKPLDYLGANSAATSQKADQTPASIKPHNNNSPKRSWQDWFTQAGKVTLGVACVALAALMAQKAVPAIIKALATPQQCVHGCAHSH